MKKFFNRWRLKLKSEAFWLWVMLILSVLALLGVARYEILAFLVVGAIIRFFWNHIMGSEDWMKEALRTLIYGGLIILFIFQCPRMSIGGSSGFAGVFIFLLWTIFGGILALWLTPIICSQVSSFLGEIFYGFGGRNKRIEKEFLSSVPEGFRKMGLYQEALENIECQLEDLPGNFEGNLLKASIYADDLKDVPRAEEIIAEMLCQEKLHPKLGALLYNRLADWRIHLRDLEGARAALQAIVEHYGGSEEAMYALQRMGRLCLPKEGAPEVKKVVRIVEDLGLKKDFKGWEMPQMTWQEKAALLAQYLEEHPFDWEKHTLFLTLLPPFFMHKKMQEFLPFSVFVNNYTDFVLSCHQNG